MKNINKVLVGIQHAIVRSRRGNKESAVHCLVNEVGETLGVKYKRILDTRNQRNDVEIAVEIGGITRELYIPKSWLADSLRFFNITDGLCANQVGSALKDGETGDAQERLADYLSSCLG